MVIVHEGQEERFSLWADDKNQEVEIFQRMLDEVTRHDDFAVFCYGTYDRGFLRLVREAVRKKRQVDRALSTLVNVLSMVPAHVYFPSYDNGLKEVAGYLGFSWSEPEASGLQSLVWRERWEATGDDLWKEKLIEYNLQDRAALRRVTEFLRGRGTRAASAGGTAPTQDGGLQVSEVGEFDRWDNNRQWERVRFVQPEFEQINRCAYFDYQRERVYVRSSTILRKRPHGGKKRRRLKLRVTNRVVVASCKCPACKGTSGTTEIDPQDVDCRVLNAKRAYDLIITGSGIRHLRPRYQVKRPEWPAPVVGTK